MRMTKAFAGIAASLAAAAGLAATPTPPESSGDRSERIAPGQIVEWCTDLAKGQRAQYRFEADAPLDFNIHAHEGDKVIYPVKRNGARRAGPAQFVAPSGTGWCWMWANTGKRETEVRYAITLEAPR
jgi:hypothetical protein